MKSLLVQRASRWLWFFSGWTALGLFSATQIYIRYAYYSDNPPDWQKALTIALLDWYSWAALSPLLFWIARRFPFERNVRGASLGVHFFAGISCSFLKMLLEHKAFRLLLAQPTLDLSLVALQQYVLTYFAIVGVLYALDYYRKYREHELKSSQLEARLAQAQLQALKVQLHPHFLFNTLHAISALLHKDTEAADRMLARLSDLLRLALDNVGVHEVRLKQELEFLERYLEIQQTRFQDRLTIRMEIAPETLDAFVPNLILQPLVENAIRHGIAPRASAGQVDVSAGRIDGRLQLEVRDDGPGISPANLQSSNDGVGLANTKARLQQHYGADHRFEIRNLKEGGLAVTLSIPWRAPNEKDDVKPSSRHDENSRIDRR